MTLLHIDTYYFTNNVNALFPENWYAFVFLLCFFMLAILIYTEQNKLISLPEAMLMDSGMNKLLHEGNLLNNITGYLMILLYAFSSSLFYYELLIIRKTSLIGLSPGIELYGIITLIVLLFPPVKWLLTSILLSLINCKEAIGQFISINIIYNFTAGVILIPLLLLTTYTDLTFVVYIAAGLLLLNYLLNFIRLLSSGLRYKKLFNIYFFIYLCILKILPVVIIMLYILYQ